MALGRGILAPSPTLIAATAALSALAAAPALLGEGAVAAWAAALGLLGGVAAVDAALCRSRRSVSAEVRAPREAFVGGPCDVALRVAPADGRSALVFEARLDPDPRFDAAEPANARATRAAPADVLFPLRARRRGPGASVPVRLRWRSPLGLWRRVVTAAHAELPAVQPDLRPVREAARRATRLVGVGGGVRLRTTPGEGSHFDALREFAPGHDRRALHWKASARHRKLLVREFRAEGSRHVVCAFDTGRLMTEPLEGLAKLDHASRAGMALAFDAVRAGDAVGCFSFAAKPGTFVPPAPGMAAFRAISAHVATLSADAAETNFTSALVALSTALRRRTLVVVFTDFADPTTAELMIDHLAALARRHLVLFATLRDAVLEADADAPPRNVLDVCRSATAFELVRERASVLARLRGLGVETLDAPPSAFDASLIDRYLVYKRRERL
ncbi:MAG TPA: DUF58 domain-containing protein [Planctomycetota bacterium]|nr:DUF58 domain-containing protein [Planctomycetota bacterium]